MKLIPVRKVNVVILENLRNKQKSEIRDNDHTRPHHPGVNISFPSHLPKAYFGERWYDLDGIVQIILGLPFSPDRSDQFSLVSRTPCKPHFETLSCGSTMNA